MYIRSVRYLHCPRLKTNLRPGCVGTRNYLEREILPFSEKKKKKNQCLPHFTLKKKTTGCVPRTPTIRENQQSSIAAGKAGLINVTAIAREESARSTTLADRPSVSAIMTNDFYRHTISRHASTLPAATHRLLPFAILSFGGASSEREEASPRAAIFECLLTVSRNVAYAWRRESRCRNTIKNRRPRNRQFSLVLARRRRSCLSARGRG